MENERKKVSYNKSGAGYPSIKTIIPKKWADDMGLSEIDNEIDMSYNKEKKEIIIKKYINLKGESMKKIIGVLSLVLAIGFAGCGDRVELHTKEEKTELLEAMVKTEDEVAKGKYDEIIKELRRLMEKGNVEAKEELEEWESIKKSVEYFNDDYKISTPAVGDPREYMKDWGKKKEDN